MTIKGTILSEGENVPEDSNGGGGSGGTIVLSTNYFQGYEGIGKVSVKGGDADAKGKGGAGSWG